MAEYVLPTSAELEEIAQILMPRLIEDRPIFADFPMVDSDYGEVMWEQEDNYVGLQQVRGFNGEPPKVQRVGMKRYQMAPGVYGEWAPIDERELATRRAYGTFNQPINVVDLVGRVQRQLLVRRLDRVESIIWALLANGTFSVPGPNGSILHTDSYTTQQFTAAVSWATSATSTPLADLRGIKLLARGTSGRFDASAKLYVNTQTLNNMLNNQNQSDLAGRRTGGFGTFNSLANLNELFTMDNLPNIVEYDEGYLTEGGVVTSTITSGGSYANAGTYPNVALTGGGGSGALATVVITGTAVTAVTVTNPGAGYTSAPTGFTAAAGMGTVTTAAVLSGTVGNPFVPFIPTNTGILVGKRPAGQVLGEFKLTRNPVNPGGGPGAYMTVINNSGEGARPPANVEVHQGFNGGPAILYPSAVVTLHV
jgi:hypothetical protein